MTPREFWERFGKPWAEAIQAGGVLLVGVGLVLTANQIGDARKVESANVGLQFDDRLTSPVATEILDAAETVPPEKILKEHGGKSTDIQLEGVFGDYDTLYYLHKEHLINDELSYDIFCYDLEALHANTEALKYLAAERRLAHDATIYNGFDKLAVICSQWDASGRGRALAR